MIARIRVDVEKKKGSKVHLAVDTLGNLLALKVTGANEQERAQVVRLTPKIHEVTGGTVEIAFVEEGYTLRTSRTKRMLTASSWKW